MTEFPRFLTSNPTFSFSHIRVTWRNKYAFHVVSSSLNYFCQYSIYLCKIDNKCNNGSKTIKQRKFTMYLNFLLYLKITFDLYIYI